MTNLLNGKKVKLQLVGINGNAFALMGAWQSAAKRQGFTKEDIDKVLAEAMSGDYDKLVCVLDVHSVPPNDGTGEDEEGDEDGIA